MDSSEGESFNSVFVCGGCMNEYYVYVLALRNQHYYVGITRDINARFEEHITGKGAYYTKIYCPIGIVCSWRLDTKNREVAEAEENKITLLFMKAFSPDCVRGGDYCQISLKNVKKAMGKSLYRSICIENDSINLQELFKPYPEIQYGLKLIKKGANHPINIGSYNTWPTKIFYEREMDKINKLGKKYYLQSHSYKKTDKKYVEKAKRIKNYQQFKDLSEVLDIAINNKDFSYDCRDIVFDSIIPVLRDYIDRVN